MEENSFLKDEKIQKGLKIIHSLVFKLSLFLLTFSVPSAGITEEKKERERRTSLKVRAVCSRLNKGVQRRGFLIFALENVH